MKSIISPTDFDTLYEVQKGKEESIKQRTATIACKNDFTLSEVLTQTFNINDSIANNHTYKPSYKVIGAPTFYFEGKDTAILKYRIERENILNDWTNNRTYHEGSIMVRKSVDGKVNLTVQQSSTSKETLEVNKVIVSTVKSILHNSSLISEQEDFNSIRFNDFNNASRIEFLYGFAKEYGTYTSFKSLTDLNLYLDPSVESHKDIEEFLAEIENLRLKGKKLQKHVFINSKKYHEKLLFASVNFKFDVVYNGSKGTMNLSASFPSYIRKKQESAELQTQIDFSFKRAKNRQQIESQLRKKIIPFIRPYVGQFYTARVDHAYAREA
jgi:hypothetical protein